MIPNFFIIGAPRCGTTALGEYLRTHPNIFFSSLKEPQFFSPDISPHLKLTLKNYLSLFAAAKPGIHKAIGEGSTSYLFSRVAVPKILELNPDAKFIVMLRNPVELVQSFHSIQVYGGYEDVSDFETAWKLEPERRKGNSIPISCQEPKQLAYSEWGMLGDQLERLFAVVPRARVKIILHDEFVANAKAVYESVLLFLEVPSDGRTDFPTINSNKAVRYLWIQRGWSLMAHHFRRIRNATGMKLGMGRGWSDILFRMNSQQVARKPISQELRKELTDFYREDVGKLSNLLGRDLSHWVSNAAVRPVCQAKSDTLNLLLFRK